MKCVKIIYVQIIFPVLEETQTSSRCVPPRRMVPPRLVRRSSIAQAAWDKLVIYSSDVEKDVCITMERAL